jgi:hypothetical protein
MLKGLEAGALRERLRGSRAVAAAERIVDAASELWPPRPRTPTFRERRAREASCEPPSSPHSASPEEDAGGAQHAQDSGATPKDRPEAPAPRWADEAVALVTMLAIFSAVYYVIPAAPLVLLQLWRQARRARSAAAQGNCTCAHVRC